MVPTVGFLITGLFAIGMGTAFFAADRHSPTSRALALLFALMGFIFLANIAAYTGVPAIPSQSWSAFFSLAEMAGLVVGFEWILRIGRTEVSPSPARRSESILRVAQILAVVYGIEGAIFADFRSEFWTVGWREGLLREPRFYMFAVPFDGALLLVLFSVIQLVRADLERAERIRLIAFCVAGPFWFSGIAVPATWMPVTTAVGDVIFLFGAIRYHVLQGHRGQFLARFLAPQVAQLVRERGLSSAIEKNRLEISVVACDLRGFSAFTEEASPDDVITVLEAFYDAVGQVAADHGATIKDFAGDGILLLVGAPIAYPDHASRAVTLALRMRDRVREVLLRWPRLGVGVGVASGAVTVGAIGREKRLEYAAVGPAVNLASRLCARAESGQVLADSRIADRSGDDGTACFEKLETAELKGFARPVEIFEVTPAAA